MLIPYTRGGSIFRNENHQQYFETVISTNYMARNRHSWYPYPHHHDYTKYGYILLTATHERVFQQEVLLWNSMKNADRNNRIIFRYTHIYMCSQICVLIAKFDTFSILSSCFKYNANQTKFKYSHHNIYVLPDL